MNCAIRQCMVVSQAWPNCAVCHIDSWPLVPGKKRQPSTHLRVFYAGTTCWSAGCQQTHCALRGHPAAGFCPKEGLQDACQAMSVSVSHMYRLACQGCVSQLHAGLTHEKTLAGTFRCSSCSYMQQQMPGSARHSVQPTCRPLSKTRCFIGYCVSVQ